MTLRGTSTGKRRRVEALRRLKSPEKLFLGQMVYLLTAERCEGCEDSKEPIVDPHTFKWIAGVVTGLESVHEDGTICARVTDSESGEGLYERRYIVTAQEAAFMGLPRLG